MTPIKVNMSHVVNKPQNALKIYFNLCFSDLGLKKNPIVEQDFKEGFSRVIFLLQLLLNMEHGEEKKATS